MNTTRNLWTARRASSGQLGRLCAAAAFLALCIAAVCAAQSLAHMAGWAGYAASDRDASAQDVALRDAFGIEGGAEDLPLALFSYVSGSPPAEAGLPALFEAEVTRATQLDSVEALSRGSVVGIVVEEGLTRVRTRLEGILQANGWHQLGCEDEALDASPTSWQATFAKGSGGLRWLHVSLYALGSATTCVFQVQGVVQL